MVADDPQEYRLKRALADHEAEGQECLGEGPDTQLLPTEEGRRRAWPHGDGT